MTRDGFASLRYIAHLTELRFCGATIDLSALANLSTEPLVNVQMLTLDSAEFENGSSATLCRFIADAFPNLNQLELGFKQTVRFL